MINLACRAPTAEKIAATDAIVEEELFVAGIEIVKNETLVPNSEVPTHITGRLGEITFTRAWYYWVVKGNVPLAAAQRMYEQQPYGRRDVRVAGHCGCPPPADPWLTYMGHKGKAVIVLKGHDLDMVRRYREGTLSPDMSRIIAKWFGEVEFADTDEERLKVTAAAYVTSYHIDSQGGLKVFTDEMRVQ